MAKAKQAFPSVSMTGKVKGINKKKESSIINITCSQVSGGQYDKLSEFIDNDEDVGIQIKAKQGRLIEKKKT